MSIPACGKILCHVLTSFYTDHKMIEGILASASRGNPIFYKE